MKIDYTEKEFEILFDSVNKAVKGLIKLMKIQQENEHQLALLRLKKEKGLRQHTFIVDDGEDDSEDSEEEDIFDYAPPEPARPLKFTVHKGETTPPEKVDPPADPQKESESGALQEAQSKGKEVFREYVMMWLQNFQVEGAEQPPRADKTKDLSLMKDGQRLLHYVISVGGVTHAVKDVWPQDLDLKLIRYVAENITQVSSILFPELGALLEHPNPLEE